MRISQIFIQLLLSICSLVLFLEAAQENAPNIARPGCKHTCGNVIIPFPFGIGANCSLDDSFEITCKSPLNSNGSNKPFLSKFKVEVTEISLDGAQNLKVIIPPMNVCSIANISLDLRKSPYEFSTGDNVFVMEGCPGSAVLADENSTILEGCGTICNNNNGDIPTNNCYGVHCCQTPLLSESYGFDDSSLHFYKIDFNRQSSGESQNCLVATLMDSDYLNKYVAKLSSSLSYPASGVPVVLIWSLTSEIEPDHNSNVFCYRDSNKLLCSCDSGYYGNPYLSNGCQVAQFCKNCRGFCHGNWDMMGRLIGGITLCRKSALSNFATFLGLVIGFGIVVLVIGPYGLYRCIKRQREKKQRANFFKRNGGLLLQQQLLSDEGFVERTRVFTVAELDKATNHFNKNRILGQGGQGTVYKGMLADGGIVAVKKSKLLDENQLEQFINEVVILSQINHINVVKLLGCCLETEIPLLVYEFIPNGTLSHHIHDPDEDFVISWDMRLKIALESAVAIAYLHSSSSIPIYHRDIKSANILLDEKHKAKVSDFGSSKTIAIDQTHLTTLVQGTLGYLDPEYFLSYQFTEKSDVYSFGVVLLELLTSKKPIYRVASSMEQKNLVTEFLFLCQNSRLSNILDPEVVREAKDDEMISVVELAKRCVSWSGKMRPTMKEVAMTLEMIIKSPAQVSRWYQEQEAFPIQFAGFDGFDMAGISEAEFSTTLRPAGVASPPYIDEHRLLPDTI